MAKAGAINGPYVFAPDFIFEADSPYTQCFPAQTPIAISATQTKPIADIRAGDVVMSYDSKADLGRGALVPRRVVRLYRGTTEEWVKLTWNEGGEAKELIATPGHHFLDWFGRYKATGEMLKIRWATVLPITRGRASRRAGIGF